MIAGSSFFMFSPEIATLGCCSRHNKTVLVPKGIVPTNLNDSSPSVLCQVAYNSLITVRAKGKQTLNPLSNPFLALGSMDLDPPPPSPMIEDLMDKKFIFKVEKMIELTP